MKRPKYGPTKVINRDRNGKIIEDLSKVKIPDEIQEKICQIYAHLINRES